MRISHSCSFGKAVCSRIANKGWNGKDLPQKTSTVTSVGNLLTEKPRTGWVRVTIGLGFRV